jgi:hypothetical protein
MLYTRKKTQEYDSLAEQVINYAKNSGFQDIKADFSNYDKPAPLTMLQEDITLTPDFTAKRGEKKFYFELVVKNKDEEDQNKLVSKWMALEAIANMKGGGLKIFVPYGNYNYAKNLLQEHGISAKLIKMSNL